MNKRCEWRWNKRSRCRKECLPDESYCEIHLKMKKEMVEEQFKVILSFERLKNDRTK